MLGEAAILVLSVGYLAWMALTFLQLVFIHSVAAVGLARRCFVTCFAVSGSAFAVLLYGWLGVFDPAATTRALGWIFTAQVLLVTVALPLVTAGAFVRVLVSSPRIVLGIAVAAVVGLWLGVAAVINPCLSTDDAALLNAAVASTNNINSSSDSSESLFGGADMCSGLLDVVTARAAYIGVCFVGILGGYAIVSTPIGYLEPVLRWKAVAFAERRVSDLFLRQQHVARMWCSKRSELAALVAARRRDAAAGGANAPSGGAGGMFSRIRSLAAASFGTESTEVQLAAECEGYRQVSTGIFLATQEAAELYDRALAFRSWRGALFTAYGAVLSLYCVVKLLVTAVSLALGRFSTVDPVTRAFALLGVVGGGDTVSAFAPQLATMALAFNVIMIVSAIRGFLLLVFRLTCNNRGVTAETSLLAFSVSLTFYLLGLSVLMRLSLPVEMRRIFAPALGTLPYRTFHAAHDTVMLLSATCTVLIRRFWFADEPTE